MNKKNIIILLLLAAVLSGLVLAIVKNMKKSALPVKSDKLEVVASFYPLYFFAMEIGGEKASVTNVTPAGAEPHDFEPSAQALAKMENSRLIILNGAGLEGWKSDIEKNIDTRKTAVVAVGEELATRQMKEDGQMETDPHVWLSPLLAQKMADRIAQGFLQADPANANYYKTNADNLKNKLAQLDGKYQKGLRNCVEKNIITSHAAFEYLASSYGLTQISIAGLSPDAEPSLSQLADIVKFAKENRVKYIFFESLASPKLSQTIASEVGAETLVLDPIEGLSDKELAEGKNYLTVMQDNLINLQTALGCTN